MKRRSLFGIAVATAISSYIPWPAAATTAPAVKSHIGLVMAWAGPKIPENCLPCDGRALDIKKYEALFDIIGHVYGPAQNGRFYIPDLRGSAQLPVVSAMENSGVVQPTMMINYIITAK